MEFNVFKKRVLQLDFSNHPNLVGNWQFDDTEKAFIASCDSKANLLKGKDYQVYYWKPDVDFEGEECLLLIKNPAHGQGTVLQTFPVEYIKQMYLLVCDNSHR